MWSSRSTDRGPHRSAPRRPGAPARALVLALGLALGVPACTIVQKDDGPTTGAVSVGDAGGDLTDLECGALDDSLRAGGVIAATRDGAPVTSFDANIVGESAEVIVRDQSGTEVLRQYVGTGLVAVVDEETVTIAGTFTGFDGPTQSGEVEGELTFTCPEDQDPGGGALAMAGTEVTYDLVICLETEDAYEARAFNSAQSSELLSVSRTRTPSGWQDRIAVVGSLAGDNQEPSTGPAVVDVTDGLFEVRGTLVTAEGNVIDPERFASLELTCGIDLTTVVP